MFLSKYYFFLLISFVLFIPFFLNGCGQYKAGLGLNERLVAENPNLKIDGWRIVGGKFSPRTQEYLSLTGEAKIIRHKEDEFYFLLSQDFTTGKADGTFRLFLYLTKSLTVNSPSDLEQVGYTAQLEKNGFQYFSLKDKNGKWLNPLDWKTAVLYDPQLGKIAAVARLSKVEPFEESFWLETHSSHY